MDDREWLNLLNTANLEKCKIFLKYFQEKDTLSEYCYEYITALLMNLSLRSAGKDKLELCIDMAFNLFLSLLECPND